MLESRKTPQRPLKGHALSFCSVTTFKSSSREIQCLCTHSRKHTHYPHRDAQTHEYNLKIRKFLKSLKKNTNEIGMASKIA